MGLIKKVKRYNGDTWEEFTIETASNIETGQGNGSLEIADIKPESGFNFTTLGGIASGRGAISLGGVRADEEVSEPGGTDDLTKGVDANCESRGVQSFTAGCGNLAAGDFTFVTGKDNKIFSNRAFASGGANQSYQVNDKNELVNGKTNSGRFNVIFGNDNIFKSSNTKRESNLIAGGSNTVDTERSIVVGYSNNVTGSYDAIFGSGNVINASYSLNGGGANIINGAYHLVAGNNNEISGQYNITSGQDNKNAGWNSATFGKGLTVNSGNTAQTILGQYNKNKNNTILEIGWGSKDTPKNIFEVYRDGVVVTEQGTLSTQAYVDGKITETKNYADAAVAAQKTKLNIGTNNDDSNASNSITSGTNSKNRGDSSFAFGNTAYVGYYLDKKDNIIATSSRPTSAVAFGWSRANANYAFAAGRNTEAQAQSSVALGNETIATTAYQTVLGTYNKVKTNTIFEIGNGTGEDGGIDSNGKPTSRSNAFEVLKDGGFNSYGDSTIDGNLVVKGLPVALRDDSTKLTDDHLVSWSADGNKFIDSGKSIDDIFTQYNLSTKLTVDQDIQLDENDLTFFKNEAFNNKFFSSLQNIGVILSAEEDVGYQQFTLYRVTYAANDNMMMKVFYQGIFLDIEMTALNTGSITARLTRKDESTLMDEVNNAINTAVSTKANQTDVDDQLSTKLSKSAFSYNGTILTIDLS